MINIYSYIYIEILTFMEISYFKLISMAQMYYTKYFIDNLSEILSQYVFDVLIKTEEMSLLC